MSLFARLRTSMLKGAGERVARRADQKIETDRTDAWKYSVINVEIVSRWYTLASQYGVYSLRK